MIALLSKWRDEATVILTAVLCDALFVYKRFQKLIQGDNVTIFDLEMTRDHCIDNLSKLLHRPLPVGYEEQLKKSDANDQNSSMVFAVVSLHRKVRREKRVKHLFVTSRQREVSDIKREIVESLNKLSHESLEH